MSRISSLTDTTGLRSPHSSSAGRGAGVGFDDEHVVVRTPRVNNPAHMATGFLLRMPDISPLQIRRVYLSPVTLPQTAFHCHVVQAFRPAKHPDLKVRT